MPKKTKDTIQTVIQDYGLPASCTIYVKTRKKSWSGSGFHIGNGYVVTASHVSPPETKGASEINITFDEKIIHSCKILASDPNSDSAILLINGDWSKIPSVVLANSDHVEIGDIVAVVASPELYHGTATVGRVTNVHQSLGSLAPNPSWNDIFFVDSDILEGASGGMCIGEDGLVIGSVIGVTGTLSAYGTGENVLCPSNKIIKLLQSLKNRKPLS